MPTSGSSATIRPKIRAPARAISARVVSAPVPRAQSLLTIPVLRPLLPSAERLLPYLRRIDETRVYTNHGPLSLMLQDRLAQAFGLPAGGLICTSSGTAALVGAILASAGRATVDQPLAIIPAFTFAATVSAVEQCGYRPYLADVDAETWMLNPERLIHHRKRERFGLIMPTAPFGRPVPQAPWRRFCEVTGIPIVIDGAASFAGLSERPSEYLGTIPVAISLHATKAFATGEGGAIATSDVELAERSAMALNFGLNGSRDCRMASTNGKMSEYHAAVGLAEFDGWSEKRRAFGSVAKWYRQRLAAAGLAERFCGAPDIGPNYAVFRCQDAVEAERVSQRLRHQGIDFRLWYGSGLHRQTYGAGLPRDRLETTDAIAPCLLGLPMAPDFTNATVARVVAALTAGLQGHN